MGVKVLDYKGKEKFLKASKQKIKKLTKKNKFDKYHNFHKKGMK